MFGRAWRIATIRGIPVNVDSSWVWIAVLVVYTLWTRFELRYAIGTGAALALAVFAAVLFFGSVLLHELAHAVAARLNRIRVNGITLVFFGGFTSARSDERGPGAAFVISAVGPTTTLVLSGMFWALSGAMEARSAPLAGAILYVGWVNLFMAALNILPGFPLDGGRMLEAAVWRITRDHDTGTKVAAYTGMVVAGLIVLGALWWGQGSLFAIVWAAIIASMVFSGARAAQQQIEVRRRLGGATVADAMDPPPPAIPADMTLSEALDRFLRGREGEAFPVIDVGGTVIGMVSFASARPIGMDDPLRPVRDAVIPLADVFTAREDERLDALAARLGSGQAALVLRDGRLIGAISARALMRWMTRA